MGNEHSPMSGIQIEDEAIEVSNFWSQHSAVISQSKTVSSLSVFIEDSSSYNDNFWSSQTPLRKYTKNLMLYRHPCIVKYVGSWNKNSKFYLAVENVTPLHQILASLNNSQISVGLFSILKALMFLHENASASHNNVSISSVLVSKEGTWKLGGMEYLCKYNDLTAKYLEKSKNSRYNKAIDENEIKHLNSGRKDYIDIYAFGVLVNELLRNEDRNELSTKTFYDYCKNELQNIDVSKRPTIKSILNHPFFSQDLILIYSFLMELPLKTDKEKEEFFESLKDKLKAFDEKLVACQLSGLLLSRMVLLNKSAQKHLIPLLLTPQMDEEAEDQKISLFSIETFKEHICPKLIEIFKVHDVQIRLLLLHYFPKILPVFSLDELQRSILPELLVGMKDTNDELVAATLKALSDLVPILGSEIVIGGKRAKLFNDGRPNDSIRHISLETMKIPTPVNIIVQAAVQEPVIIESMESHNLNELSERPRPDGEEGTNSQEILQSNEDDLEKWDDWNANDNGEDFDDIGPEAIITQMDELIVPSTQSEIGSKQVHKKSITDILELDIKNQVSKNDDDIDFFGDMEPVISNSNKFLIDEQNEIKLEKEIINKLAVSNNENGEEGWGDDWD